MLACVLHTGAVHLIQPAISDKLARLKQRLPSRLTSDAAAAAVAATSGTDSVVAGRHSLDG